MNSEIEPGKRSLVKRVAIVIGVVLGALFLVGIGVAIATSVMDRDSTSEVREEPIEAQEPSESAEPEAEPDPTDPVPGGDTPEVAGGDAESLIAAIETAVAHVDGDGATQIEVHRTGWAVDVRQGPRTEVEVFVDLDGTATIRDTDDDDDDDPLIELSQIPEIVHIAIEAAGGGMVEEITTDDDDDYLYEVDVRLDSGAKVEVELDASLRVVDVDFD